MSKFPDLIGTLATFFQLGKGGAGLRSNSGTIEARTFDNSALAPFACSDLTPSGKVAALGLTKLSLEQPEGLKLGRNALNAATQIDFAPGRVVMDYSGDRYICISSSIITKRLDALWASGTGNGGRFSGSLTASTWYHAFVMRNATGSIEFGFDTSATGANKPTGWQVRRIGSIMTDSSSNIRAFQQSGDIFYWDTEIEDVRAAIPTSATIYTLSVPPGVNVQAIVRIAAGVPSAGNTNAILLTSAFASDQAPGLQGAGSASVESYMSATGTIVYTQSAVEWIVTNTTANIRARASFGSYSSNSRIATIGWRDSRGN